MGCRGKEEFACDVTPAARMHCGIQYTLATTMLTALSKKQTLPFVGCVIMLTLTSQCHMMMASGQVTHNMGCWTHHMPPYHLRNPVVQGLLSVAARLTSERIRTLC